MRFNVVSDKRRRYMNAISADIEGNRVLDVLEVLAIGKEINFEISSYETICFIDYCLTISIAFRRTL